ncbi:hypothetical protein SteCoe_27404 [Stentor coeruleus]|uniref:Uncharacterized protein n=1 Tax=Stentor coeruleus TaxID=5963 RepID=A0A1R2BAN1_9CILI|nr:hypothetical protein SteCoe_27404 [Stentor coeruleus]
MSKNKKTDKFEPRIGFENSNEQEKSLSFSDFEIEGQDPRSGSFFSGSEKHKEDSKRCEDILSEDNQEDNESQGLNHAFYEEKSESVTDKEVEDLFKQNIESTALAVNIETKRNENNASETREANENVNMKNEQNISQGNEVETQEIRKRDESSLMCCKCKGCFIF